MRVVRGLLAVVGGILVLAFVCLGYETTDVGGGQMGSVLRVGLPHSPWLVYESGPDSFSSRVLLNSWSWACIVGAWFCFWLRRRLAKP